MLHKSRKKFYSDNFKALEHDFKGRMPLQEENLVARNYSVSD